MDGGGDRGAVRPAGRHGGGRVEVHVDPEPFTAGPVLGVQRPLADIDQGVDPVGAGVVAAEAVTGRGEGGVDERPRSAARSARRW